MTSEHQAQAKPGTDVMTGTSTQLQVRVAKKTLAATDVVSFELVPLSAAPGTALPRFTAGAHINVRLGEGLSRSYSLCNDPAETHRYVIAVLLDPHSRGGSRAMHALQVGDVLSIGLPANNFALAPSARQSLLLAGGIGVTPLLCMAQQLAREGAAFALHYSARSRAKAAFLDQLRSAPFASQVQFHFDDGEPAQRLAVAPLLSGYGTSTHLYVCGPKGFIEAVLSAARAAGWPETHLHLEYFAAEPVFSDADGAFQVKLARSGKLILVPKGKTIVQALTAVGVDIPTSCEQGVCGTCLTRVIQGIPDHRDMVLTPSEQAENSQMLPCCSRSKTPLLVLDL